MIGPARHTVPWRRSAGLSLAVTVGAGGGRRFRRRHAFQFCAGAGAAALCGRGGAACCQWPETPAGRCRFATVGAWAPALVTAAHRRCCAGMGRASGQNSGFRSLISICRSARAKRTGEHRNKTQRRSWQSLGLGPGTSLKLPDIAADKPPSPAIFEQGMITFQSFHFW